MLTTVKKLSSLMVIAGLVLLASCGKDEVENLIDPPTAGFTFTTDGLTADFTNASTNDVAVSWNFGDGTAASTEENPSHEYAEAGTYTVVLTATGLDGKTDTESKEVTVEADEEPVGGVTEASLTGGTEKAWKISTEANSFKVGPNEDDGSWWTLADMETARPCLANDRFIFKSGGEYEYDAQGDVFGEAYMGVTPDGCVDETTLAGDKAAWGSNTHEFTVTPAAGEENASITVTGTGAFIALPKAYNGGEYNTDTNQGPVADRAVEYEVIDYTEDTNGNLTSIKLSVNFGPGFWTFVLVPAE